MSEPPLGLGIPTTWPAERDGSSPSWGVPFGEFWRDFALTARSDEDESRAPLAGARRLLDVAAGALRMGTNPAERRNDGRLQLLRAAAAAAEANALAWGPFAGARPRVHWLRQLERDLERVDAEVRCAEREDGLDPVRAEAAARRSLDALMRLAGHAADTAGPLRQVERATTEFAVLAIRGADSLGRRGVVGPSLVRAGDRELGDLARIAARIAADAEGRRSPVKPSHPAAWLQEAILAAERLGNRAVRHALARDVVLRGDAAAAMRSAWTRLTLAEMLVAVEADALLSAPILQDWPELCAEAAGRAYQALAGAGMFERPRDFEHTRAAAHHSAALISNVGRLGIALHHGDQRRLERVSEALVDRVARALAALWSLDAAPRGAQSARGVTP